MKATIYACLAVLALWASPAAAQNPVNPTAFEFTSSDHPIVTGYDLGFFLLGAQQPVSTIDIGKPIPRPDGVLTGPLNARPLALGSYELKVRAKVGTTVSAWGGGGADGKSPVPFDRALSSPANLKAVP